MSYRVRSGLDARKVIAILSVMAIAAVVAVIGIALYNHRPKRVAGDSQAAEALPAEIAQSEAVLTNLDTQELEFEGEIPVKTVRWSSVIKDYPDAVAWITVPDTEISFPVLKSDHSSTDELPVLDSGNDPDFYDPNSVIHGSCAEGGALELLLNYGDSQFFADHPYIYVTVGGKLYEYAVYAAYEADSEDLLTTYNCYDYQAFETYIDQVFAYRSMNANFEPNLKQRVMESWRILSLQAENGSGTDYYVQATLTGAQSSR